LSEHLESVVLTTGLILPTPVRVSFSLTNLFVSVSVVGFGQSIIISMGFARAVEADDALRGTASGVA